MEKIIYFDNAATTFPKPDVVYDFADKCFREFCVSVGRGQYKLASFAARLTDETRQLLQCLFHSSNKKIVFTHTATEALNLLLQNIIKDGANVYISPFEHNAVTRVIEHIKKQKELQVHVLPFLLDKWEYDMGKIKADFSLCHPDVLVVSHASNVCGFISPIKQLCALSKEYDCTNIIDMCQSAGIVDVELASDNYDYAVFDGHKTLYGPFGVAGIIGKPMDLFDPIIVGGTGVDSLNQEMPSSLPERFEAGSHNIVAIAGLNAAIKWINSIGVNNLYAKEKQNHRKLIEILLNHSNIDIKSPLSNEKSVGIVSCVFRGYSSDSIGNVLSKNDIAVRTGLHCAPLAHKTLGTLPAGTVRFSTSWFTSEADFKELDNVLSYIEENS